MPALQLFLLCIACLVKYSSQQVADNDITFVISGMRHGNRNPEAYCCGYTEAGLGKEGEMQLTKFGKQQAYYYGQNLAQRYPQIFSAGYKPKEVSLLSSSADRCQATLQALLAGAYPLTVAGDQWLSSWQWQPLPYAIDDDVLRVYKTDCARSRELWAPIGDDSTEAMRHWLEREKDFVDYVTAKANISGVASRISQMADVADNLANMKIQNKVLPTWVTAPVGLSGKTNDIYEQIMDFAEAHQIACARSEECGKLMAGRWLHHLSSMLDKTPPLKFLAYTTHTEITLSMMYLMGVGKSEVKHVSPSGGFLLEFKPSPMRVRLIHSEPKSETNSNGGRTYVEIPLCGNGTSWCEVSQWRSSVRANFISDIDEACGNEAQRSVIQQTILYTSLLALLISPFL